MPKVLLQFPTTQGIIASFRSYEQLVDASNLCDHFHVDARLRDRMPGLLDSMVKDGRILHHVSSSGVNLFSLSPSVPISQSTQLHSQAPMQVGGEHEQRRAGCRFVAFES